MSESNSQEVIVAPQINLWDDLIIKGLNVVLGTGKLSDVRSGLIKTYPELVLPRLELLDNNIQTTMIEGIFSENPSLFIDNEDWWNYICRAISKIESYSDIDFFNNTGLYVLLNRVKDLRDEVNWKQILLKLSEITILNQTKCQGFSTVLNWLIESDPDNLRELLYRTETKSYPSKLKIELYKQAIDLGLLDNKLARRIRSDSSGSLSAELIAYLFENRAVFSDEDFQDLVTQFSDTKHKWVARYVAMNMPMHLVPFLMGIKDDAALKIMEKRMELAEENS